MHRRSATTRIAAIDDVIMNERAGVQQFERSRGAHDGLAVWRAGGTVAPITESRPQAFSALEDERPGRVGERLELVGYPGQGRCRLVEELDQCLLHAACQGVHGTNCRGEPDWVP